MLTESAWKTGDVALTVELGWDGYQDLLQHARDAEFREAGERGYCKSLRDALLEVGRYEDARGPQRLMLDHASYDQTLDPEPMYITFRRTQLAMCEVLSGHPEAARKVCEDGIAKSIAARDSVLSGMLMSALGRSLLDLGKEREAEVSLQRAQKVLSPLIFQMPAPPVRFHLEGTLAAAEARGDSEAITHWRALLEKL